MIKDFRNILVTGGLGFIGSNFIRLLHENKRNFEITVIDNLSEGSNNENLSDGIKKDINLINCSIGDDNCKEILNENNIDCVVNFAAQTHVDRSISDPLFFYENNILETVKFIENCRNYFGNKSHCHFHQVSTDEVYGSLDFKEKPFSESSPFLPSNPYSASKASIDLYLLSLKKTFNFKYTTSFCSNNFGPNQMQEKFIPSIIDSLNKGVKIKVYGDGKNIRDWIYVDDHCNAIISILNSGISGEGFNIGGQNEISNISLIHKILNIKFHEVNINVNDYVEFVADRKGHDLRYSVSNDKLNKLIGWHSTRNFEEDLALTIKSYQ